MRHKLTAFSWGYFGWGRSTPGLVRAFDAVERARGYKPPLFVDVRASRKVRATGFRGGAFKNQLGATRYRWMQGFGNSAIATGRGPNRLIQPQDANELLDLIHQHDHIRRRVIFFCSCESPWRAGECHRSRSEFPPGP